MAKANVVFTKDNEYYTPKYVVDYFYPDGFDYDPATCEGKAKEFGVSHYDTIETDGLKQDWTKYERIWINPPFCIAYNENDTILTNHGWKKYLDISKSDLILSVNEKKELEWVNITEIVYQDYRGKLVGYSYDRAHHPALTVTYNHRCIVDGGIKYAEDLTNKDFYTDGYSYSENNEIPKKKILPEKEIIINSKNQYNKPFVTTRHLSEKEIPLVNWAKFLGLWIADGSMTRSKNSKTGKPKYSVYIGQNEDKESQVLDIMNTLGFTVRKTKSYIRDNYFHYYIHSQQLWEELQVYGKSDEKFIPREILDGNKEVLQAFFDGYVFGDSYKDKRCNYTILSSRSLQLIKDLQELCLKLGKICHYHKRKYMYKGENLDYYYLIIRNNSNRLKYSQIKTIDDYEGKIFCLHLSKNHNFFVCHDGYVSNTGNTEKYKFLAKAVETYNIAHNSIYVLFPIEFLTTARFHDLNCKCKLFIPRGRINFESGLGKKGKSPAFGSVVIKLEDENSVEYIDFDLGK